MLCLWPRLVQWLLQLLCVCGEFSKIKFVTSIKVTFMYRRIEATLSNRRHNIWNWVWHHLQSPPPTLLTAASNNIAVQELKNSASQMLTHYDDSQLSYSVWMILCSFTNTSDFPCKSYHKLWQTALVRDLITISKEAEYHFCNYLFTRQTGYS
jgi:hypothetical protein